MSSQALALSSRACWADLLPAHQAFRLSLSACCSLSKFAILTVASLAFFRLSAEILRACCFTSPGAWKKGSCEALIVLGRIVANWQKANWFWSLVTNRARSRAASGYFEAFGMVKPC